MAQYLESVEFPPVAEHEVESEPSWVDAEVEVSVATYQAYQVLYYAFIALLAVAGMDKFLHLSAAWDAYVSPSIARLLHMSPGAIAWCAGVTELLVATGVALRPKIGSWAATVWLALIAVNLLTMGQYVMFLPVLTLAAAGFAFTRLSAECN